MKNWIIIFLLFSAFGYCQNPNTIFFKPDNSISADSIVFKNKKLGEINGILKFKRNKKIKFSVYKNGKKYDFKISETSLGVINVLSLKLTSDNKISLSVHRGEILYGSTLKDTCTN